MPGPTLGTGAASTARLDGYKVINFATKYLQIMCKFLHCQVELVLSSGEELSGVFCHGRRSGRCTVRSPAKGIRCGG